MHHPRRPAQVLPPLRPAAPPNHLSLRFSKYHRPDNPRNIPSPSPRRLPQMYVSHKKLGRALDSLALSDPAGGGVVGAEDQNMIRRLQQEAKAEELTNTYEVQRSKGTPLAYGQVIQLEHVKSGRWARLPLSAEPLRCLILRTQRAAGTL